MYVENREDVMAINTDSVVSNAYAQTYAASSKSTTKTTQKDDVAETKKTEAKKTEKTKSSEGLGKTIGEPKLSKEAQKYYEQLKKKFGNYDFVLVSEDEIPNAQAKGSKFANGFKTVVLINEEKIEQMAKDENFRKKYEGILSGAQAQLDQLKESMEKSGANVKGYGMQLNADGTTSFFAVMKKSSADQKARIEKTAEKKRAEKKATEKKAEKDKAEERIEKSRSSKSDKIHNADKISDDDTVTITANSIEELMQKMSDFTFAAKSDSVQTDTEKLLGQHIDFKG